MAILRFQALEELFSRENKKALPTKKASEFYKTNVFDMQKMKNHLSRDVFDLVVKSIEDCKQIDRTIANQLASGMKSWAMKQGATHYTHWFHPLNNITAEKHDSFFNLDKDNIAIEEFRGEYLTQQEPDASSLPSGGIRNTFEARGYTAWDPSSPAFIVNSTLCIPTIFVSYTGESLDYKAPLLKANSFLNKAATSVCKIFDNNVSQVQSNLGWEQEYFLIDEALYNARPDLILTDRTLMGHSSAKDQQLEDHYFGSIPERVASFMYDMEVEAWKLGIPLRTRHNEVAPNQFECAPMYEEMNIAIDHNQLLMDIIKKVAREHKFRVIFHEKPFKEINGSGKHNNWSLTTNTGVNLLSPGKNSDKNLQFLSFFVNTIKAVYDNSDLLRASIMSAGNEHRLGANEAPPAIISTFIGKELTEVLNKIESQDNIHIDRAKKKETMKMDIPKIPSILLDNTDRNRTSPFAFTGNRFEFRAVGSTTNCASPMIALNTAVAKQLVDFKNDYKNEIKTGLSKNEAIMKILKKYIIASKKVRFEGDGYSTNWVKQAEKLGLTNIPDTVESVSAFLSKKTIDLFENNNILTKRELEARYEIRLEIYIKKIQIESRVLGDLATNHIVPTAIKYQNLLINNVRGLKEFLEGKEFVKNSKFQLDAIKKITEHISAIKEKVEAMVNTRKIANKKIDIKEKATVYSKKVKPFLFDIRTHIDALELMVDDEIWPLPKYRELLFTN